MWDEIDEVMGTLSGAAKGETIKKYSGETLMGRVSVPEDVAETASYLSGKGSDYMTGQTCTLTLNSSVVCSAYLRPVIIDGGLQFS